MRLLIPLIIGIGVNTLPALAAGNCAPKAQMSEALASQFGEIAFATGTTVDSAVKFYGNPRTGTWSVVVTRPNGTSCVVAIGDDLEVGIATLKAAEDASFNP